MKKLVHFSAFFTFYLQLLTFNSNAQSAYITHYYGCNNVSVIDCTSNTVTSTIPIDNYTVGVSVSPDGRKVYVTTGYSVRVINTATNTISDTITIPAVMICVSPNGRNVYVTDWNNGDGDTVSVINTATNTVTATIAVGSGPWGVAVSPDGSKIYVGNLGQYPSYGNTVSVIDSVTNTVVATIPVGNGPYGIAVTPDGSKVYVANSDDGTVSVINSATNTVVATIPVGNDPNGIAVTPDGSKVYVTNYNASGTVRVINTTTDSVVATIPVGIYPYGISVTPDGSKVYVANSADSNVSVISTATNTVLNTIHVGSEPWAFGNFISSYSQHMDNIATPGSVSEDILVYPNPATSIITIDIPKAAVGSIQEAVCKIEICNLLGEEVYSTTNYKPSTTNNIDVSAFPNGVYVVQVKTEKGIEVKKFIKE